MLPQNSPVKSNAIKQMEMWGSLKKGETKAAAQKLVIGFKLRVLECVWESALICDPSLGKGRDGQGSTDDMNNIR